MPLHRYYYEGHLEVGRPLVVEGDEGHHLVKVVRAAAGQEVEVVDGKGTLARAVVEEVVKGKGGAARLRVSAVERGMAPPHPLVLVQALPRLPRLDLIVEKATELGVARIHLFAGERSEKKSLSEQQWQRARTIAIAAMKQCGSLYLPQVCWWPQMREWPAVQGRRYFGDVAAAAPPLLQRWRQPAHGEAVAICVGPEGGLAPREEEYLRNQDWEGVKLHANVLRTDTASLVALALFSHLLLT